MIAARRARAALPPLVALGLALATSGASAAGGALLLEASETAILTVVGRVGAPEPLDVRGWAAELRVERVLSGDASPGQGLRIGWDEVSPRRRVRFAEGDRILVALDPAPQNSLWRSRFPRADGLAVAARGKAFLRDPDAASVDALGRFLALGPRRREGRAGVAALLGVAAEAVPPLAGAALRGLARVPELGAKLGEDAIARFDGLLADDARPLELRAAALELAGRERLAPLRLAIAARAAPGSPLEAPALAALGRIDGGLPADRVAALLARPEGEVRAVAVRQGGAGIDDARIAALASEDPAPEVRAAAVEMLAARRGPEALEALLPRLFDPDEEVRRSASLALGAMGSAAVPRLREIVEQRPFEAPVELAPAVAALALAGPEGQRALAEIHAGHPDPRIRKLAGLALGRLPGDEH